MYYNYSIKYIYVRWEVYTLKSIIDKIFFPHFLEYKANDKSIGKIKIEIEIIKRQLKETLNKKQKKLLLRIEDGKDLINEISNSKSFAAGFKMGLKIGYEVNKES